MGADGYEGTSFLEKWKCLKNEGYTFAFVDLAISPALCDEPVAIIKQAREAGFVNVDGHMIPNVDGQMQPKAQVDFQIQCLVKNKVNVDQIWITVKTGTWTSTLDKNINYIKEMMDEVTKLGYRVGIHTYDSMWNPIMQSSTAFNTTNLWYMATDNKANFDDYKPFGGWTKPIMKTYGDSQTACAPLIKNVYREIVEPTHVPPVTSTGTGSTKPASASTNKVNWAIMIISFLFLCHGF